MKEDIPPNAPNPEHKNTRAKRMFNTAYSPHPSPNMPLVRTDLRICVPYTGKPSIALPVPWLPTTGLLDQTDQTLWFFPSCN
jgi:hypothetical protein